jgi:RNA-directed DNA polymerase
LARKIVRWARRKYKTLRRHKRRGEEWLQKIKEAQPQMFDHWRTHGA